MMMVVGADDRSPGLLPPRKRLLAGLKHNRNPPASSLPRPLAPSVAEQAMTDPRFIPGSHSVIHGFYQQCSACGLADSRLLLHRLSSPLRILCSSCVLSFHRHMYCYLCLQVFKDTGLHISERPAFLTCRKCQRLSHRQCARQRWPFAFDWPNSATTLCIDCSKPGNGSIPLGIGDNFFLGEDDRREAMERSSKRQRTGRVCMEDMLAIPRAGSKWMSYDLIQQAQASPDLPLVDEEALAAAKVVAAIAEKGARDAKLRAKATAAIAAQAAARAKRALDNAFRAGQEEALAQSLVEELPLVEASSDRPTAEPMMQQQVAMNVEVTRQRSSISVPRNSRSSAPVHKRRTLSAIVASEESRAQANLSGNQGMCLPVVKQQPRRPRSDASRRSIGALDAARAQVSSSKTSVTSLGPPLPAALTPCSSQAGTTLPPASSGRLDGVLSHSPPSVLENTPRENPESSGSIEVSPGVHHTNVLRSPASESPAISFMNHQKLLPSMEAPSQEIRHETSGFAAGAQDLNLPAEESIAPAESNPLIETLTSSPAVPSPPSRLVGADTLSGLETFSCMPEDKQLENTPEKRMTRALLDVTSTALKSSDGLPFKNSEENNHIASCSNSKNGGFNESCLEGSCFQSGQSADADLGRLEIVLPGIEAVERDTPEGSVETKCTFYGKEVTFVEGQRFSTRSYEKPLGERVVLVSSAFASALISGDGICSGAGNAKICNHLGEQASDRIIEEQGKIIDLTGAPISEIMSKPRSQPQGMHHFRMTSFENGIDTASISKRNGVSSYSIPLQNGPVPASPLELARHG